MSATELVNINSGTTSARSVADIASAARVQEDGRLSLDGTAVPPAYQEHAEDEVPVSSQSYRDLFQNVPAQLQPIDQTAQYPPPTLITPILDVPRLNIVIHIVGSRGDVQPFLALAKELQTYKHRWVILWLAGQLLICITSSCESSLASVIRWYFRSTS